MAWIESHQSLSRHKKTLRVVSCLKVDRHKLIGHLHELWWWALDNLPADGDLGDLSNQEIADGAEWTKDADAFVHCLTRSGFIDDRGEAGRYLHDWYDYAGKLLDKRAANAERMRTRRAGGKNTTEEQPAHVRDNVRSTTAACTGATQPTQPTEQTHSGAGARARLNGTEETTPEETGNQPGGEPLEFTLLAAEYPNPEGRQPALHEFRRLKPDLQTVAAMMRAVRTWKQTVRWQEQNGRFVPQLAKWIRERRWDEPLPSEGAMSASATPPAEPPSRQKLTVREMRERDEARCREGREGRENPNA